MTSRCPPRMHLIWLFLIGTILLPHRFGNAQNRTSEQRALKDAEVEYEAAKQSRTFVTDRIATLRDEIAKATGRVQVSADAVRQAVEKLQEEKESLLLDAAGAEGRRKGLEMAVAKYTDLLNAKARSDPAATELEKVVSAREAVLADMKQRAKAGLADQSDIPRAEADLAHAKAELAAAQARAAGAAATAALDGWNREAMNLSIEDAEREARLKYIQSRLDQYAKVMPELYMLDEGADAVRATEARVRQARDHLTTLREKMLFDQTPSQPATRPATSPAK